MTGLDVLVILGDDEALASLAADNTSGAEAAVDGGVVSLQGAVLGASDGETVGLERTRVGETGDDLGGLVLGDVEASGGGPHGTIMSVEGTLGDTSSSNEGVIDVRLPRHVVCVALCEKLRMNKSRYANPRKPPYLFLKIICSSPYS